MKHVGVWQKRRCSYQHKKKLALISSTLFLICLSAYSYLYHKTVFYIEMTERNYTKIATYNSNSEPATKQLLTSLAITGSVLPTTHSPFPQRIYNTTYVGQALVPAIADRRRLSLNMSYLSTGDDILQMKPISFLKNFKNPCWYDAIGIYPPYLGNAYFSRAIIRPHLFRSAKRILNLTLSGKTTRLRCLPHFYLIGQPKCGTTNLYYQISSHPDVTPLPTKEPHWWTRYRIGTYAKSSRAVPLQHYLDLFDIPSEVIETRAVHVPERDSYFHPVVTGDGSASTMWDNDFWWAFPENHDASEPRYIVAHYIHHIQPNAKIIVALRNPTERLYSDYMYFSGTALKSPQDFHQRALQAVQLYRACAAKHSMRACAYSRRVSNLAELRLRIGLYNIYLRDWLDVFGRDQIHVIRLADYASRPAETLERLFTFLELRYVYGDEMKRITSLPVLNAARSPRPAMLDETRTLLDSFYAPYNVQLAQLLQDKRYLWLRTANTS